MYLKSIFITISIATIIITTISCSNDSSGAENKNDDVNKPANKANFLPAEKLPKGASRLHNLPSNVKGFVQRNYPGYLITIVVSDLLCSGGDAVDVAITKIGSPDLSLIFKPDGTYIQQEQDVPLNAAPIAIMQTLKAKYPGYSVGGRIEKLTQADNVVEYGVDLSKGAKSKEVILNTNGTVVCEN